MFGDASGRNASATRSRAWSQVAAPRRRCSGSAVGLRATEVSPSAAPLEHSRPKLAGCSGSPAIALPSAAASDDAAADAAIGAGRSRPRAHRRPSASQAWPRKARDRSQSSGLDAKRKRQRSPRRAPSRRRSSRPMTQLCSGQVTLVPCTMPWLSGPPLCGQRSSARRRDRRRCETPRRRSRGCVTTRAPRRRDVDRARRCRSRIAAHDHSVA